MENLSKLKMLVEREFEMSDMGNLLYFRGMEFQRKYVKEIINRLRMDDSNPASSPVEPNLKLEKMERRIR